MTVVLDAALRASVPILVALAACMVLRRRSAALRHRVLATAAIAAIVIVPLSAVLPSWAVALPLPTAPVAQLEIPAATEVPAAEVTAVATPDAGPIVSGDLWRLAFLIWIAGVAAGIALVLRGIARLLRVTMGSETVVDGHWRRLTDEIAARYGITRPIALLTTRAPDLLATWGTMRPRVLLPAHAGAWSEERAHAALCHELAHVKRFDWPFQIGAEALRIVFWFNPLLWILCARLRREGEQACDDIVLGTGMPAATYASHLVDIARACRPPGSAWLPAMSVARPSTLEGRITAMLNTHLNRRTPTWRSMAVIFAALACVVLPAASLGLSAQAAGPLSLTGSVYDPTGLVLPAVEVALVNDQQVKWSAVTDGTGKFEFSPVGPGKYVLEAALPGFKTLRNEFTLFAPGDWSRNVTMQMDGLQETISVTAKRPQKTARAVSAGGAGPVRVGGNIKVPMKLRHVAPAYPPAMRDAGLSGVVPMEALIGTDGTVISVRVLSAQVHPEFARAAQEAVRQWVFSPTLLNGVPVEVQMAVSMQFRLED